MGNTNMHKARKNKNDEFYTLISDIKNEELVKTITLRPTIHIKTCSNKVRKLF